MKRNRKVAERRGQRAELVALWFLRLKGYRLLARRFKTGVGEVDLIMRRGSTTAFIEVKARQSVDEGLFAVSSRQSRRIAAAANVFAARDAKTATGSMRFDIVVVPSYLWPTHIENAFEGRS